MEDPIFPTLPTNQTYTATKAPSIKILMATPLLMLLSLLAITHGMISSPLAASKKRVSA